MILEKIMSKKEKIFWTLFAAMFTSFAIFQVKSNMLYCDDDVWSKIKQFGIDLISNIRSVVTVVAALLVIIAVIMIMVTNDQRKTDTAKAWIVRIVVCWALIFCVASVFNYINENILDGKAKGIEDIDSAGVLFLHRQNL